MVHTGGHELHWIWHMIIAILAFAILLRSFFGRGRWS